MQLVDIRQWQWMLLSLIVGALIGYVRQEAAGDLESQYGESINGQKHFEQAIRYTSTRKQFGQPISDFQAIRFKIATMATDIEAARQLMYYVCSEIDAGRGQR